MRGKKPSAVIQRASPPPARTPVRSFNILGSLSTSTGINPSCFPEAFTNPGGRSLCPHIHGSRHTAPILRCRLVEACMTAMSPVGSRTHMLPPISTSLQRPFWLMRLSQRHTTRCSSNFGRQHHLGGVASAFCITETQPQAHCSSCSLSHHKSYNYHTNLSCHPFSLRRLFSRSLE